MRTLLVCAVFSLCSIWPSAHARRENAIYKPERNSSNMTMSETARSKLEAAFAAAEAAECFLRPMPGYADRMPGEGRPAGRRLFRVREYWNEPMKEAEIAVCKALFLKINKLQSAHQTTTDQPIAYNTRNTQHVLDVIFLADEEKYDGVDAQFRNCKEPADLLGGQCAYCEAACNASATAATFVHVKTPCECMRKAQPNARHVYQPLDQFAVCERLLSLEQKQFQEYWVETAALGEDVRRIVGDYRRAVARPAERAKAGAVRVEVVPAHHNFAEWEPIRIAERTPRRLAVLGPYALGKEDQGNVDRVTFGARMRTATQALQAPDQRAALHHLQSFDVALMWDHCPGYIKAAGKKGHRVTHEQCMSCAPADRLVWAAAVGVPTIAHSGYAAVQDLLQDTPYQAVAEDGYHMQLELQRLVHNETARMDVQAQGQDVWRARGPQARLQLYHRLLGKP